MIYTTLISEDPVVIYSQISADSDPDTITDASQEIQARIDALQDIISVCEDKIIQWKRFKNSVILPVSRLPHEVLAHVFLHLRSMETRQDKGMLSWMVVAHVCSRWRNAALDCPELWDQPYFGNLECAMEMIARVKSAPLELVIFNGGRTVSYSNISYSNTTRRRRKIYRPSCTTEAAKLAFANMHRARRLYLWEESIFSSEYTGLGVPDSHRHPWELDELQALSLQQLTLSTSNPPGNPWGSISPIQFPFDRILKYAPNLRNLCLENWTLNGSASGLLDQLTDLEISIQDIACLPDSVDQRTPAGIISVLRGLQNLKNLRLRNATVFQTQPSWDQGLPDEFPVLEHAELSRLQTLEIQDHFRSCLRILEGIHYPSTTSVNIKTDLMIFYPFESNIGSDLQRLEANEVAASLQLLASRLETPPVKFSILLTELSSRRLDPFASNQPLDGRCYFTCATPSTTCRISRMTWLSVETPLRAGTKLLSRICDLIPLHGLKELHCSLPYSDVEFWMSVGRLPSIEILTVEHTNPALLFVLSTSEISSTPANHTCELPGALEPNLCPIVFFPALRHLVMQGWQFGKSDDSNLWAYPRAKASLPDLIRSISARYEQTKIHVQLTFNCPGIAEPDVADIIHENNLDPRSLQYHSIHNAPPTENYAQGKENNNNLGNPFTST